MTVPFDQSNNRIFYACAAVLVGPDRDGRNDVSQMSDPTSHYYLDGVTSIGVDGDMPSSTLLDIGRAQRKFNFYGKQEFQITIERNITDTSDFFYYSSDYGTYTSSHILNANNLHCQGHEDSNDKCLRSYDITLLFGADQFSHLGKNIGVTDDGNRVYSITYQNCLISNLSYSMAAGETLTETITLICRHVKFNTSGSQVISNY